MDLSWGGGGGGGAPSHVELEDWCTKTCKSPISCSNRFFMEHIVTRLVAVQFFFFGGGGGGEDSPRLPHWIEP